MDLAALSLCSTTTQADIHTLPPGAEWNAKSIHCLQFATVNSTTCQVITLLFTMKDVQWYN